MTLREHISAYLTATGSPIVSKTERRWVHKWKRDNAYNQPRYVYLGANGSCRVGINFANSTPVSSQWKMEAMAYKPSASDLL